MMASGSGQLKDQQHRPVHSSTPTSQRGICYDTTGYTERHKIDNMFATINVTSGTASPRAMTVVPAPSAPLSASPRPSFFISNNDLEPCDFRFAIVSKSMSSTTGPSDFLGSSLIGIRSTINLLKGTATMVDAFSTELEQSAMRRFLGRSLGVI